MGAEELPHLFKLIDDQGQELDALYSIELVPGGFDLIVESRGGANQGRPSGRNKDYAPAMELYLSKMRQLDMVLRELHVVSSIAMKLPEADRKLKLDQFSMPLSLKEVPNIAALRHSIGRASAAFGRRDGNSSGGNFTKRIRLRMEWHERGDKLAPTIARILGGREAGMLTNEPSTDDPDELATRVRKATNTIRSTATQGTDLLRPAGQSTVAKSTAQTTRFVRDPNVIAWVLHMTDGTCEVCGCDAPFVRPDGEPYLEVHHVLPLAAGGPDTVDNAVACCPNCHRQLHHAADKGEKRTELIARIERLKDWADA